MTTSDTSTGDPGAGQAYSVTVLNENAKFQVFSLFQTIPTIIGPSSDPVSLAWIVGAAASGSPANPSQSIFSWTIDYAATTGYIQDAGTPSDPRRFQTASQAPVQINKANRLDVTYQGVFPRGAPCFPSSATDTVPGVVVLASDNAIPTTNQQASQSMAQYVGLAMSGKPAIAVQLEPNLTYQFTPKPRYFLLAGSFVEGQVIDSNISSAAYEVDFLGVTAVKVRFTQQNQFVPA